MSFAALASGSSASKGALWTGHAIQTLIVLFLLFDSLTKIMKVPAVLAASAQMGFSARAVVAVGIVLLACTVLYVIPRTAILGAILLTGYLGGATITNFRAGDSAAVAVLPAVFGVLVWGALFLREPRLRALIPLRTLPAR